MGEKWGEIQGVQLPIITRGWDWNRLHQDQVTEAGGKEGEEGKEGKKQRGVFL